MEIIIAGPCGSTVHDSLCMDNIKIILGICWKTKEAGVSPLFTIKKIYSTVCKSIWCDHVLYTYFDHQSGSTLPETIRSVFPHIKIRLAWESGLEPVDQWPSTWSIVKKQHNLFMLLSRSCVPAAAFIILNQVLLFICLNYSLTGTAYLEVYNSQGQAVISSTRD